MKKARIDKILVEREFAESLSKAQALVMTGVILADEQRVEKPSQLISVESKIRIKNDAEENRFVGRGGLKLEKALREFQICVSECVCLDIGASTGGFTDCLLQNGAKKVVAIDAGTNQIDWKLRTDARVEVREKTNARYLKPEDFDEKFNLITVDVSFISVTKIFPALVPLIKGEGKIIVLIKPQFEAEKGEVGSGGVVTDAAQHARAIEKVNQSAEKNGLKLCCVIESPILGMEGNKEFLALYEKFSRDEKGKAV